MNDTESTTAQSPAQAPRAWATSGRPGSSAAGGVGLALHGWDTFLRRPVTEADIEAELRRRR